MARDGDDEKRKSESLSLSLRVCEGPSLANPNMLAVQSDFRVRMRMNNETILFQRELMRARALG